MLMKMDSSGAQRHTYCLHLELKLREGSPVPDIGLSSFNNDAGFITGGTFVQSVLGVGAIEVTGTANVTVSFDAGNWAPMGGALFDTDYILVYDTDADLSTRKRIRDIQLSEFNNDEGWTANGGTMNNWFINTDHPSATKRSVQEDGEVFLIGGTGIELSAVTENIPQQRWELTISATSLSPWSTDTNGITYTAGNVGIGVASNSSYDLRVAGTVYFDSKLLVSGGGIISNYMRVLQPTMFIWNSLPTQQRKPQGLDISVFLVLVQLR
jgi:hypothetical protein